MLRSMARRLFHAIVLVGTGMGAACASRDAPGPPVDGGGDGTTVADTGILADGEIDTFPGIMPMMTDSAPSDTGKSDTFPTIAVDTSMPPDTFPGIMPPPSDGG